MAAPDANSMMVMKTMVANSNQTSTSFFILSLIGCVLNLLILLKYQKKIILASQYGVYSKQTLQTIHKYAKLVNIVTKRHIMKKNIEERLQAAVDTPAPATTAAKSYTRTRERGRRLNTTLTIPASQALEWIETATGSRAYDIMSMAIVLYSNMIAGNISVPMHSVLSSIEGMPPKLEGRRVATWLTKPASDALTKIQNITGTRAYDVVSTALVIYANTLRANSNQGPAILRATSGRPRRQGEESPTVRDTKLVKTLWCEEVGGRVEGNVCYYDKFEVTLAGTTESMKRSISLTEIPDNKEEFTKMVLGGYSNIYEARRAVEKQ